MTPPYVDDGLIEVVGFRDAWHGLVLLAPNGHGTRLAQVCVLYDVNNGCVDVCFCSFIVFRCSILLYLNQIFFRSIFQK